MCEWPSALVPARPAFDEYAAYQTWRLSWLNSRLSAGRGVPTAGSVVSTLLLPWEPSAVYARSSLGPSEAGVPPGGGVMRGPRGGPGPRGVAPGAGGT